MTGILYVPAPCCGSPIDSRAIDDIGFGKFIKTDSRHTCYEYSFCEATTQIFHCCKCFDVFNLECVLLAGHEGKHIDRKENDDLVIEWSYKSTWHFSHKRGGSVYH